MLHGTFYLLTKCGVAQQADLKSFDYTRADSIAINLPKAEYTSIFELAHLLTDSLETEHEKFRTLYRWVTDNIGYKFNSTAVKPRKVLKSGKSACGGYASLLSSMTSQIGITCISVPGYSKSYPFKESFEELKKPDHAWNAVRINNVWYLVDPTWAAGAYDLVSKEYVKDYSDLFYMTDPAFFMLKHYPEDKQWLLCDTIISRGKFVRGAIHYSSYQKLGIKMDKAPKGLVSSRLKLLFECKLPIDSVQLKFSNEEKYVPVPLEETDEGKQISYKFTGKQKGSFFVFINGLRVWGFYRQPK